VFHGSVSERAKTAIMSNWHVGLNPVESGGGSSLKLPDYFAHGLPTLSTRAGARGFAVEEHLAGRVVSRGEFRHALAEMLGEPATTLRQGLNAHQYAHEDLTWDAVSAQYRGRLKELLAAKCDEAPGSRLLVVSR
jgi:glycosyltransferase involved in cell wall biosynthesis